MVALEGTVIWTLLGMINGKTLLIATIAGVVGFYFTQHGRSDQ